VSIQRNVPQETLYDCSRILLGIVPVLGPFTVVAIPVPSVEDPSEAPIRQFEEKDAGKPISVFFPFQSGNHKRMAMKVIDFRSNEAEVMG